MATEIEYAQISNRVYKRTEFNRTDVPTGWTELQWNADQSLSGFSAGVYKKGSEIVIAYTGTNEGKAADFAFANVPAGAGLPSAQVTEAMLLYLEVKKQNPGATISFTGHSLGGGLASLMAVFFDKSATVFDAAPFEATARNVATLGFYQVEIQRRGYIDPDFNAYTSSIDFADFNRREAKVQGIAIEGEILASLRAVTPTVQNSGTENIIKIGEQTLLDRSILGQVQARTDLHSMTLLASMLQSKAFEGAVKNNKYLLESIFDSSLYNKSPEVSQAPNFLDKLYIAQTSGVANLLDNFAADLQKFAPHKDAFAKSTLTALTAVAIEYYYHKEAASAGNFFKMANNTLQFTNPGADTVPANNQSRASAYLDDMLAQRWAKESPNSPSAP